MGGNKGDNLVSAVRTIRNLGANRDNVQNLQLDKIANDELKKQLNKIVKFSLFVGSDYYVGSYYYYTEEEDPIITNIIFSEEKGLELTKDKFPEKQTENNPKGLDYSYINSIIIPPNVIKVSSDAFDDIIEGKQYIKLVLENKKRMYLQLI